jgi:hypothetical protein
MMRLLEFLEMLALVIGVAFTVLVLLPFSLAWLVARWVGL